MQITETQHKSRTKFLDAALHVIRAKGYAATRIEDICEAAELTKGSFFHHSKSKEDLALAAAGPWSAVTSGAFASAPHRSLADPLDRVLSYVDFRKAMLRGELPEFTCFVGTMVQKIYDTHPALGEPCDKSISDHAAVVEADIAEAMRKYDINAQWTAESLALYTQAVPRGAFILAKAKHGHDVAAACIDHLHRYIELLFAQPKTQSKRQAKTEGGNIMATPKQAPLKLTAEPEIVTWPETHYVFVEKIGPFLETAGNAWQSLHQLVPAISDHNKITGYTSLYKMEPKIYRAGVSIAAEPKNLPEGVRYEKFRGGKYSRFVLTGPYSNLPEACGRVFDIVSQKKIRLRDDYGIENYANDPRTTPEDQLITEILVPTV